MTHALCYVFRPNANSPTYSYFLDTKSDTLKLEIQNDKETKVKKIHLDSTLVQTIFQNGIKALESIDIETVHKPQISNCYLNLQLSHNKRNLYYDITDQYYLKKLSNFLTALNKLLPADYSLPIKSIDYSDKKTGIGKYQADTYFKLYQSSNYSKKSKELFYNTKYKDSISVRVSDLKYNVSNVYIPNTAYTKLKSLIILYLNSFAFGQGNKIADEHRDMFETTIQIAGINATCTFFDLSEFKKTKEAADMLENVNSSLLNRDFFLTP
jgi:hypothetical protein